MVPCVDLALNSGACSRIRGMRPVSSLMSLLRERLWYQQALDTICATSAEAVHLFDMRRIPYVITDVFTSTALTGNQLAVVTDAHQLREDELQLLAKETNLSETTFIYPRDAATERERGVKVRIFTTDEELEFAGHPTLGTANVLRGTSGAKEV